MNSRPTIALASRVPLAHPNWITAIAAQQAALRILDKLGKDNVIAFPVGQDAEAEFIESANTAVVGMPVQLTYIRDIQTVLAVMGFRPDGNDWIEVERESIKAQGTSVRNWAQKFGKQVIVPLAPGTLYNLFFSELKSLGLPKSIPVAIATLLVAEYRYNPEQSSPVKFVFDRQ